MCRQELEAKLTSGKDIFHEDWCALAQCSEAQKATSAINCLLKLIEQNQEILGLGHACIQ